MLQTLITFFWKSYIYLLFVLTIVILFLMIKGRAESKRASFDSATLSLSDILLVLSFLTVSVSGLLVLLDLEIFGRISLSEPLNFVVLSFMIISITGSSIIMIKENVRHQKKIHDSASLILVSALLILSFLAGFSIGARLSFINLILTLFLLVKAQHYILIFFIALTLNLFFLASYFLF